MTLKGKADLIRTLGIIAIVALVVVVGGPMVGINLVSQSAVDTSDDNNVNNQGVGGVNVNAVAVTLRTSGVSAINGTNLALNGYLSRSDDARIVGETSIAAAGSSLTTSGSANFNGYVMLGNDPNFGTDRGVNVYFKRIPLKYTGASGDYPVSTRELYPIVNPTYTVYDDGTAESTANITVGAGQKVVTTEIKIAVTGTDGALGNPDPLLLAKAQEMGLTVGNRPLAMCFNQTTPGLLDKARPSNTPKFIPVPGILSGRSVVECAVLDTPALVDGVNSDYRFGVTIESRTGQNPGITDNTFGYPLDLSWTLNDQDIWTPGWEDASDVVADAEIGLAGEANTVTINYT